MERKATRIKEASGSGGEAPRKLDLFILRHGEAGSRSSIPKQDSERALTSQGRAEITRIAKSLKVIGLDPDRIYTSPLRRARETAEIASRFLKSSQPEEWEELKPNGNRSSLYRKLAKMRDNSKIVLVGHEPYLTTMIGEIVGSPITRLVLKKGGIAKIRVTSFNPRISGELRWLLTPKIVIRMS